MTEVTILGLTRIADPKPNLGGSTIVARFDCVIGAFQLNGCALARTPKHGLVAWPPRLDGKDGQRRSLVIRDSAILHQMMTRARDAFRALGGTDVELIGRILHEPPMREVEPIDIEGILAGD